MFNPLTGFKNDPTVSNCIKAFEEHPDLLEEVKNFYLLEKVDDVGEVEDRHLIAETSWKSGDFIHFTYKINGQTFKDPYGDHEGPTDGRDFKGQFAIMPKDHAKRILDFQKRFGRVRVYRKIEEIPVRKVSRLMTNKKAGPTLYSKLERIKHEIDKSLKWDHISDATDENIPEDNITARYRLFTKQGPVIFNVSVFNESMHGNEIFTSFIKEGYTEHEFTDYEEHEFTNLYTSDQIQKLLKDNADIATKKFGIEEAPVEEVEPMGDQDKDFLKSTGIRGSRLFKRKAQNLNEVLPTQEKSAVKMPNNDSYYEPDDSDGSDISEKIHEMYPGALAFISAPVTKESPDWDIMNKTGDQVFTHEFMDGLNKDYWDGDDVYYMDFDVDEAEIQDLNNQFMRLQREAGSKYPEPLIKLEFVVFQDLPNAVMDKLYENADEIIGEDDPWVD
jgi:hypothetical protein